MTACQNVRTPWHWLLWGGLNEAGLHQKDIQEYSLAGLNT